MKLPSKIKIDFLDFIRNGKFDYIKLGQSKEWIYVVTHLNEQEIDYCKSSDQFGVRLLMKSGVELFFAKELSEVVCDPNLLHINCFQLRDRS